MAMGDLIREQERADILRKMAQREAEERRRHRRFMTAMAVLAVLVALLLIAGYRGGML